MGVHALARHPRITIRSRHRQPAPTAPSTGCQVELTPAHFLGQEDARLDGRVQGAIAQTRRTQVGNHAVSTDRRPATRPRPPAAPDAELTIDRGDNHEAVATILLPEQD